MLSIDDHPLLDLRAFITSFPKPIGELETPTEILDRLSLAAPQFPADESLKPKVRDLFRNGGYKPTGRGKPASEYLRQADTKGTLSTINLPVDICNVVSLHSGLPISVVDADLIEPQLRVGIAPPDSSYVFNASGQTIKIDGLLCLFDATGPCANGVKDSQRTKTSPQTVRTLSLIWGTKESEGRSEMACRWYRELLETCGASISKV